MIRYSVIIPHFNDSIRLQRLIHSIPHNRKDIEILVIDDCSHDVSQLLQLEKSIDNLRLLSTPENSGAGCARNIGLEHARGKWLVFADSDDEFLSNAFPTFDCSLRDDDDLVFFLAEAVNEDDFSPSSRSENMNRLVLAYFQSKDYRALQDLQLNHVNPVAKVYSREFIAKHKLKFDEVRFGDDVAFNVLAAITAARLRVKLSPVYRIYRRPGSVTASISADTFFENFLVYRDLSIRLQKLGIKARPSANNHIIGAFRYGPVLATKIFVLSITSPMKVRWSQIFCIRKWFALVNKRRSSLRLS